MKHLWLLVGLLVGFALPVSAVEALSEGDFDKIRVFLAETAAVSGDEYTLGEIAELQGNDSAVVERIAQLEVGRSPLPGRNLTVTRSLLLSRLRFHKVDIDKLVFPNNDTVKVYRAALKVLGKDIEEAVLAFINDSYPDEDVQPKLLAQVNEVFLPRGELSYDINEIGIYKKEGGYRNYQVNFRIDGELVRKVTVRAYLKVYKEIFVARDTIQRDKIIEETDLVRVRRNVDRTTADYVTEPQELVGKIATRTINPKEVIQERTVTTPPLVNTGDRLTIIYETSLLRLTAPGISMSKGRMGEKIRVRNADSKLVVYATVQDENTVQVQ
jgi:flagella basal body P-ring formation protein FlgA